jgi:hypothetical protein
MIVCPHPADSGKRECHSVSEPAESDEGLYTAHHTCSRTIRNVVDGPLAADFSRVVQDIFYRLTIKPSPLRVKLRNVS